MESLKRLNRDSRAYRNAYMMMLDTLNLMVRSFAVELHEEHGFGAERLSVLTDNAIKRVHGAIARYEGEFTPTALDMWCKDFNFNAQIGFDSEGAVKFVGGVIKKKGKSDMRTPEEIRAEMEKVERAKKNAVRKVERCDIRIMELACEHNEALNEENRKRRAEAAGDV